MKESTKKFLFWSIKLILTLSFISMWIFLYFAHNDFAWGGVSEKRKEELTNTESFRCSAELVNFIKTNYKYDIKNIKEIEHTVVKNRSIVGIYYIDYLFAVEIKNEEPIYFSFYPIDRSFRELKYSEYSDEFNNFPTKKNKIYDGSALKFMLKLVNDNDFEDVLSEWSQKKAELDIYLK